MREFAAATLGMCLVQPVHAGQPIHESLVECAVLIGLLLGEQSVQPGEKDLITVYADAAQAMRTEATRPSSSGYVTQMAAT